MNNTIEQLRQQMMKSGKLFIFNPEEEIDEDRQVVYFYFLGKDNGKEVIYDAFMCTLAFDYKMAIWDEAEAKMIDLFPQLEGKDYTEYTEEQQDELDEIMDEIYESNLVRVQESLDLFDHEDEDKVGLEVSLNVAKITDEVIEKFIKEFNADIFQLDDDLHTFTLDEEE